MTSTSSLPRNSLPEKLNDLPPEGYRKATTTNPLQHNIRTGNRHSTLNIQRYYSESLRNTYGSTKPTKKTLTVYYQALASELLACATNQVVKKSYRRMRSRGMKSMEALFRRFWKKPAIKMLEKLLLRSHQAGEIDAKSSHRVPET
ncbi:Uncharacterized protein Rs2_10838 [Raphanus sativus]|nr:Uncharacterized protein Rs2_10838 [Raphanus sativus]